MLSGDLQLDLCGRPSNWHVQSHVEPIHAGFGRIGGRFSLAGSQAYSNELYWIPLGGGDSVM